VKEITADQGDCIGSLAVENGFFWQTLWNHGANASLKQLRKDPFTLCPGDVICIPDLRIKEVGCVTDKVHKFQRKGVPGKLRLRFCDHEGKPRTNLGYSLDVDGVVTTGQTDGDGTLERFIAPDAQSGRITLHAEPPEEYELRLGHLEPIDTIIGQQARLANLGFYDGPLDGEDNDELAHAIQAFQAEYGLDPAAEMDDQTRARLEKEYAG
jgi:hypothetical protein